MPSGRAQIEAKGYKPMTTETRIQELTALQDRQKAALAGVPSDVPLPNPAPKSEREKELDAMEGEINEWLREKMILLAIVIPIVFVGYFILQSLIASGILWTVGISVFVFWALFGSLLSIGSLLK